MISFLGKHQSTVQSGLIDLYVKRDFSICIIFTTNFFFQFSRSVIEKAANVLSSKPMRGTLVASTVSAPTSAKSRRVIVDNTDEQRTVTTKGKSQMQVTISGDDKKLSSSSSSSSKDAGNYVKDLRDKLKAGISVGGKSRDDQRDRDQRGRSNRDIWSTRNSSSRTDTKSADAKSSDSRKVVEEPKRSEQRKMSIQDESHFEPDYDETNLSDSDASANKKKHKKHKKHKKEKKAKKEKKDKNR